MAARSAAAARRYAKALFALARDEDRIEAVRGELDTLVELTRAHPTLREVLVRPLQPAAQRRGVVRQVGERLGLSPLVVHFVCFLIDRRRLLDLVGMQREYARLADEAAGRTHAEVIAASPLRDDQIERLRRALAARTGREVQLSVRVDPLLIGGAVARVGDLVFDGSLRTQLAQLRASFLGGR